MGNINKTKSIQFCTGRYEIYKTDNKLTFIKPYWYNITQDIILIERIDKFNHYLCAVENKYLSLLQDGYTKEETRVILPNCLKTELVFK
jgi:thymidylate synthase ThyX